MICCTFNSRHFGERVASDAALFFDLVLMLTLRIVFNIVVRHVDERGTEVCLCDGFVVKRSRRFDDSKK